MSSKAPPRTVVCSFCRAALANTRWLFRSLDADPVHICDACIAERMSWIVQDEKTPGFIDGVIAIQKAELAERWAESHPDRARVVL